MKLLKNSIIIYLLVTLHAGTNLYSQVTIGTQDAPAKGSLLDLKQFKDGTAERGVLLPRVSLINTKELYPMFLDEQGEETAEYKANKQKLKKEHMGLTLYNTSKKGTLCKGLYTWDGEEWERWGEKCQTTLQDLDGNTYPVGKFGKAGTWMLQNLRTMHLPDGTPLPKGLPLYHWEKRFEYPNNSSIETFERHPEYGLLYSWAGATNGKVGASDEIGTDHPKVQGICPEGWHIPSDKEWKELEAEMAANPTKYSTNTKTGFQDVATTMKSAEQVEGYLNPTNGMSNPPSEDTGFNTYLLGYISEKTWYGYSSYGSHWTGSSKGQTNAYTVKVIATAGQVYYDNLLTRSSMAFIRCKKTE